MRAYRLARAMLWAAAGLSACPAMAADEPAPQKDLAAQSLPLRTALHHDPTLASPLDRLLSIYRGAGKADALVGLYRGHVAQYPTDASGRTVLVRLLVATGDPESLRSAQTAVGQFPDNAYLHYLLHQLLRARRDPDALEHLDKAIELESRPSRKLAWIDVLLPVAMVEGRPALAEKHLRALAALVEEPQQRLLVAQKMLDFRFHQLALDLLEEESAVPPAPETMVSIELEAATAEVGLDRMEAAGARLDKLLSKLTADYWRRDEIVRRRLALVGSQAERTRLIADARLRVEDRPHDVAAVLDLAQVLAGLQFRRDALEVLLEAGRRLPESVEIEKQILDVFDHLRDERGREKYLAERIKLLPDRTDLVLQRVKTLYLLSRRGEALSQLTRLAETLDASGRVARLLETARFLRRSSLLAEAAEVFHRVVRLCPDRLDVRRELAETLLALGDRQQVHELFTAPIAKQASLENLLDLVQFMIEQRLFIEARTALSARLEQEKSNLEIRMLLLTVQRQLGNFRAGRTLIEECRELADTGARYRLWLESAAVFHDDFDTLEEFLRSEHARLEEEPQQWTPRRLERRLAFAEIAARGGRTSEVLAMLRADLEDVEGADGRARIRRQLVSILDKQQNQAAAVGQQLEDLAKDDPQRADEYNARLAMLHAKADRHDLATRLLKKIDVARIQDVSILSALRPLYRQHGGNREKILAILQRLTVLDPGNREHWQEWVSTLAAGRSQSRLRAALRRLLADVEKLSLSEETRTLVQHHVADSYWRSIADRLADGREASLADTLPLLDSVQRMSQDDQQLLWIAWIRAYILGRLDRQAAQQQAIEQFDRVVADLPQLPDGPDPRSRPDDAPQIAFPDGLAISLEHARKVLSSIVPPAADAGVPARRGPLPEFRVKWTFHTRAKATVTAIVPLSSSRTLICDRLGGAHCVDAETGKLLWHEPVLPIVASQYLVPPNPLVDGQGRLYLPEIKHVACRAVEDGRLLWRAHVGALGRPAKSDSIPGPSSRVAMFLYGEDLLTYEPASGTLTKIDRATGRIVWDQVLAGRNKVRIESYNSGASLSGDKLLVYGSRTAILDARTGQLQWSFEPSRVRKFPVELGEPAAGGLPTPAVAPKSGIRLSGFSFVHGSSPPRPSPRPGPPVQYVNYLQPTAPSAMPPGGLSLAPPAVVWAALAKSGTPRHAELIDRLLLLFDPSGIQIIDTDLPLASKRVEVTGQFVGMAGRIACLAAGSQLSLIDVTDGTLKQCSVQEVAGKALAPFQAAVDGPLVYLTGPGGIACVKAATAEQVFHATWPKEITLPAPPEPKKPAPSAVTVRKPYAPAPPPHMHGPSYVPAPTSPYVAAGPPYMPPSISSPVAVPAGQAAAAVLPSVACVDRGVLYTVVTPTRVVALTESNTDGQ